MNQIADYALIGDCLTAALVGRDGSIDFLCWPHFDSDAVFAALLGDESHGRWLIAPVAEAKITRAYLEDTLILQTSFETDTGLATVTDFMPLDDGVSSVMRLVRGVRGEIAMRMELLLRFGYGQIAPWAERDAHGDLRAVAGPSMAILRASVPTKGEALSTISEFSIRQGDCATFSLTHQASHLPKQDIPDPEDALRATTTFWRDWIGRAHCAGRYAAAVKRSLITLKALTFAPTGGLVAAATTSLPEAFGGQRNWDYRYCWIRDSSLALLTLMNAGYNDEAEAWRDWVHRAVAGNPADMQIMYGIRGERRLTEWIADFLPGFQGAKPVRIGNAAHGQFQLDVYGELMQTYHLARVGGFQTSASSWNLQRALVDHVASVWDQPDEGIWEVRGAPRKFTFSRVMAWLAIDRAISGVEMFGLEGPVEDWKILRARIRADIWANGYDRQRNRFKRAYDDGSLDASLLTLAIVGFVEPANPAFIGTVEAIENELLRDGLVLRYNTDLADDGLPPGEGAFLACSFWLADAYALIGRTDDATRMFEHLLSICNDVGLLAEEYDPRTRRFAGNFPQAFSHIGLITTAFNLTRAVKPTEQRAVGAA